MTDQDTGESSAPVAAQTTAAQQPAARGRELGALYERAPLHDYARMLAIGALGFALDFGIFNILLAIGWHTAWANLLALVVAGLATFKGNLSLTFAHRRIPDRRLALAKFVLVTLVSIGAIEVAVIVAALYDPGVLALNAVKAAVTILAVAGRFVLYREWVFRHVPV